MVVATRNKEVRQAFSAAVWAKMLRPRAMNERNGPLGWLVGAGVLATVPLSVVLVVLSTGGFSRGGFDDDGGSPYLAFMEAGSFAYVVLGISLFASLAAMVFIGLSGTRPALQPLAIGAFVPTLVLALMGLKLGQAQAEEAIEHASAADRLTILAGSAGESLNLGLIAFIVCGVGLGLIGLASLVTVMKEPRVPRLLSAVTAGTLGLACFAFAFHLSAVIGTFRAVAHASPADRGVILGVSFMESEPRRAFATALLGLAVLISLTGGAVVLRTSKAAAATLVGAALLLAGSVWSFEHGALSMFSSKTALTSSEPVELLEVFGPPSGGDAASFDTAALEDVDDIVKQSARSYRNEDAHRVSLYANTRVSPAALHRALVASVALGARVELVGRGVSAPIESPEWARRFVEALSVQEAAARIVPRTEEACDACVGRARLVGETLQVGPSTKWALNRQFNFRDADEMPKVVDFEWDGSMASLIKASNIASTNGAVISVAVK